MSEFDNKPVYDFAGCVDAQKPHNEQFVKWLEARPQIVNVRKATLEEDMRGIDFFITTDGGEYTIQLKVDFKADKTGNLPCETISQAYHERNSVIGAEFNMAGVDYIFFLLIPSRRILGYRFSEFVQYVIQHYSDFRNFAANNDNPVFNIEHWVVLFLSANWIIWQKSRQRWQRNDNWKQISRSVKVV